MAQANKISYTGLIKNGIFSENPIFRVALSLCPAVAVTNSIKGGLLMGIGVLFVQVMVNLTISALRNFIHPRVRIPIYILVIALWVTVTDLLLHAYAPAAYKQIGLYIKLIVAFAIILSRAELFASKNKVIPSVFDGIGMGIGFLLALVFISFFRELIGKGSLFDHAFISTKPVLIFVLPAGGFFAVGLLMGLFNWIDIKFFGGTGSSGGGH